MKETTVTSLLVDETTTYTFIEVCTHYHIPEALLMDMVEQGLFHFQSLQNEEIIFSALELQKIERAFRLHQDLEVNLPGVALALDLLEEIDALQQELTILRKLSK